MTGEASWKWDVCLTGVFTELPDAEWHRLNKRERLVKCRFAERTRQGEGRDSEKPNDARRNMTETET